MAVCEDCGEVSRVREKGMVEVEVDALECANCGLSPVELWTSAEQKPRLHPESNEELSEEERAFSYWAHDGDPVVCSDCNALHRISVDEDGCHMSWDW